jgi:3-oxoacyl-[acyl-carrier-protein] synthase III
MTPSSNVISTETYPPSPEWLRYIKAMKEERVAIDRSSSEYSAACVKTTIAMLELSDDEIDAMSEEDGR